MKLRVILIFLMFIVFGLEEVCAKPLYTFEGKIDLTNQKFELKVNSDERTPISIQAEKVNNKDYRFHLNVDHFKTPNFDFSSEVESFIEDLSEDENFNQALSGKIWSQYATVDYKPIRELSSQFHIKDRRIELKSLNFGNVSSYGFIELDHPYKVDMTFKLSSVEMSDFLKFWMPSQPYASSGMVSGEIRLTGHLGQPTLKGSLESYNGFVHTLKYDSIHLNIEGVYPDMKIVHSSVTKEDNLSFIFEGPIQLNDLKNFKHQVKSLELSPLVNDTSSQVEWTLKQLNRTDSGKTELKILKRKGREIGSSALDDSDMIGIERTMEF